MLLRRPSGTFWFPRGYALVFDPATERDILRKHPMEVVGANIQLLMKGQALMMLATLEFSHGVLRRKRAALAIYRPLTNAHWRFEADGQWTPALLVEDLERSWHSERARLAAWRARHGG